MRRLWWPVISNHGSGYDELLSCWLAQPCLPRWRVPPAHISKIVLSSQLCYFLFIKTHVKWAALGKQFLLCLKESVETSDKKGNLFDNQSNITKQTTGAGLAEGRKARSIISLLIFLLSERKCDHTFSAATGCDNEKSLSVFVSLTEWWPVSKRYELYKVEMHTPQFFLSQICTDIMHIYYRFNTTVCTNSTLEGIIISAVRMDIH